MNNTPHIIIISIEFHYLYTVSEISAETSSFSLNLSKDFSVLESTRKISIILIDFKDKVRRESILKAFRRKVFGAQTNPR